jgi:SAM-dependent methyltransferase
MLSDNCCRLCGHFHLEPALALSNVPRNIQRLFCRDELDQDRSVDLDVLRCARCGFVQIRPLLEDEYYDDYLMTTTHSRQMQEYQQRQATDFVCRFALQGQSVHEMGCGDGSYLEHLRQAGAKATGIEPSRRFRELALARGFEVQDGYVSASRSLPGGPYDAFVTRQVLEHVPDIEDFLQGIWHNLKPGAPGLVEVPSLEKALLDHRYYDFFPDHVNYFSQATLRLALELNGFDVLETFQDMFDEYNVAIIRRREAPDLSGIQHSVDALGADLRQLLHDQHHAGRRVAVWGAGGKGLSVLAEAGVREVDLLIDGDPHKIGLLTPVSQLEVRPPSELAGQEFAAVIITAMAYRYEIERLLREEFGFCGAVYILGHRLERSPTWSLS